MSKLVQALDFQSNSGLGFKIKSLRLYLFSLNIIVLGNFLCAQGLVLYMNRKAGEVILLYLFAGVILISGCIKSEHVETPANNKSSDAGKGDESVDIRIIKVFSNAFESNSTIPRKYTCNGENINPPLEFTNIPEETESLVLIMDDPDSPMNPFTHWIVWNIEPVAKIEEDSIPGVEGMNNFRKIGYGGPCPSSGTHRYYFRVYALDRQLELKAGSGRKELESEMIGHIIAEGELMGKYGKT